MKLSIATTLYDSASYLHEFHARMTKAAKQITDDYEIIFVNDGSPDEALEVALSLYEQDDKVRIIDLSRNFGHHKAMMTGLTYARGDRVFLIDCDLEIEPEILSEFYAKFQSVQADVVFGVQDKRQDKLGDQIAARLFYVLFNWFSSDPLPFNLTTVRLMSKRYVSALVAHQEREVLIAGLWVITGFKQIPFTVKKSSKGSSAYNLSLRLAITVNAITSFSNKPLILIFYLGGIISALAMFAAFYLVMRRVFFGVLLAGWPSLIVSVWLLGGLQIICLGTIGMYVSKIFMEAKQRPYTIIRQIYERK